MASIDTLARIKKTAFFKSLSKNSKKRLIQIWPTLSSDQMTRILILASYEKLMINFIANQTHPILSMAKKAALQNLTENLEKFNKKQEKKILDNLLNKIE